MRYLHRLTLFFLVLLVAGAGSTTVAQTPETRLGWKLGAQAYTFKPYTFFEVLDKLDSCGLSYVEASPGRDIGGGMEGKMDYHMPLDYRGRILARLKEKKIKLHSYGVVVPRTEADWRLLFEFARYMGIVTIVSEPEKKDFPLLSRLCDKYGINIAIHNHPEPSLYWNPDLLLSNIKGQSKRIGACADIGHWVRSGLDPLACIRKLKGHIIELHFKDLNEMGMEAHDVHWGTGISGVGAILEELKRQGFKGAFFAEYEYRMEHNTPDVAACMRYFRRTVGKMTDRSAPFTFFVLGDWGMKGDFYQKPVARQMIRQAGLKGPEMILTVGDNFYNDGSVKSVQDEHWQLSWENIYQGLTQDYPWYPSLGNHDYQGTVQAQLEYHAINPCWNMPARYYTFTKETPDHQRVRIVIMDTDPYMTNYYSDPKYKDSLALQDTARQTRWLDSVLAHSTEKWKLVFGHHPIYCVGGKEEDFKAMRGVILPILKKHHVQAFICGHDHVLQYHLPKGGKMGFIISGTGAKPVRPPRKESFTLFSDNNPGFTIGSIRGKEFTFSFIDTAGRKLYTNIIPRD